MPEKKFRGVQLPAGIEPEWLPVNQACIVRGVGRTRLYKEIAAGILETTKRGRRRLVRLSSARAA